MCGTELVIHPEINGDKQFNPSHTLQGMWLLIHVGIKVKPC